MTIELPEKSVQRLREVAEKQGVSVEDLVDVLLDRYEQEVVRPGTLAELAQNAIDAGLASEKPVDTAERSREILNTEYADYLKRRMDQDDDHRG